MTVYARPGVHVVKDASNEYQVTLTDLSMESTGRYRCEVSTEAPSFATVSNYGDMVVVGESLQKKITRSACLVAARSAFSLSG